jgi:F-type H+-transporting ATPase subunit gamma
MEMVATVKSKLGQNRIKALTPYSTKLAEILRAWRARGRSPTLLGSSDEKDRPAARGPGASVLVVVTGNRGLCGGYNANVLRLAEAWLREEEGKGRKAEVYMVGKKGISRFRFLKIPVAKAYTHIKDLPSFKDTEEISDELMAVPRRGRPRRHRRDEVLLGGQHKPVEHQPSPSRASSRGGQSRREARRRRATLEDRGFYSS